MTRWILLTSTILALSFGDHAQAGTPPITVVNATLNDSVFKDAVWNKPIVIRSEVDAAKHFGKDALATLNKQVDFTKQFVLVFAWKGSGGDKLKYAVAGSFPEQIFFSLHPGLTRDLRSHTHVYALRRNVCWSTAGKEGGNDKDAKLGVRPIEFNAKDPTIIYTIGGMSRLTTMTDAAAVEKLVGKASAQALIDTVDFQKEAIVLVSWSTSGPPEGVLKHEIKSDGAARRVIFYVQAPPGGGVRGQRARIGADFFAIPRDMAATFDPEER